MTEEINYGCTLPLHQDYSFKAFSLADAERIYEGERPGAEELVSKCDYCTSFIQKAREKGLGAKVIIETNTHHLVGLV
jgi:hypothetical protein